MDPVQQVKRKLEMAKLLLIESLSLAEDNDLKVNLEDMLNFMDPENNTDMDIDTYYWVRSDRDC